MKVQCAIYRGGTSKPIFFWRTIYRRMPKKEIKSCEAFGTPDVRQIDGLGGADALTSKVGYIGAPTVPGNYINYTFGYVGIAKPKEVRIDSFSGRGNYGDC